MNHPFSLTATAMGIDTHQEPVVYMRKDCTVCRAEGFNASARIRVSIDQRFIVATLNVVDEHVLAHNHIGFSNIAWQRMGLTENDQVDISHARITDSMSLVRKKIYGHPLNEAGFSAVLRDIVDHLYTNIEVASFLTACAGDRMNFEEIVALTRAMVRCGEQLQWPGEPQIFDKHCIGGIPGNRTTPIVIALCSAAGLIMPKTSSRAITSPAGTADTMEVITTVDLSQSQMRTTVERTGACLAWGGSVNLSPADDLLIRIERALDIDGEGQLVASVLSKKSRPDPPMY